MQMPKKHSVLLFEMHEQKLIIEISQDLTTL